MFNFIAPIESSNSNSLEWIAILVSVISIAISYRVYRFIRSNHKAQLPYILDIRRESGDKASKGLKIKFITISNTRIEKISFYTKERGFKKNILAVDPINNNFPSFFKPGEHIIYLDDGNKLEEKKQYTYKVDTNFSRTLFGTKYITRTVYISSASKITVSKNSSADIEVNLKE